MTLYYSLVFALLVLEMVVFMSLIVPLPFKLKRKLFAFISESPLIARLQYGLRITFIFILILFLDSVNRVYRVQTELSSLSKDSQHAAATMIGSERMEVQARKFYSQRNMYLCGFTLFLSIILNRTYMMILETLRLEDEIKRLKGDPASKNSKDSAALGSAGQAGEIGALKKELAQKERDIENLKKQSEGLTREYNRMGDQVSGKADETPKKDR
ncbi:BAP31 domain protein [Lineolata rhizophorae]|uniref:Endoplasmic reticulum transmembrane protein n=1 Tax=Lineolata rhizophorae TaxID=578093 RepID=A0A6A6P2D6_9PEZI|nr:BAP31 domain protein [Lineolata rhizophorae]